MWIGSEGGLDRYDPNLDGFIRHVNSSEPGQGAGHTNFTAMLVSSAGTLWLISADKTLFSFEPATGVFVSHRSGVSHRHRLSYNHVNCLYEERTGTVWFGTAGGGLSKFSRGKLKFAMLGDRPSEVNDLQNYSVTALAQGPGGEQA